MSSNVNDHINSGSIRRYGAKASTTRMEHKLVNKAQQTIEIQERSN